MCSARNLETDKTHTLLKPTVFNNCFIRLPFQVTGKILELNKSIPEQCI